VLDRQLVVPPAHAVGDVFPPPPAGAATATLRQQRPLRVASHRISTSNAAAGTAACRPAALVPPRLRTARRRLSVWSAGVARHRRQTAATIADRRPFTPPRAATDVIGDFATRRRSSARHGATAHR